MDKNKEIELYNLLVLWFKEMRLTDRNVWQRNKVAALIKSRMEFIGKWRRKRRQISEEKLNEMKQKIEQKRIKEEEAAKIKQAIERDGW